MHPDELYQVGMRPERFGSAIRPMRRALWRLLRPFLLVIVHQLNHLDHGAIVERQAREALAIRVETEILRTPERIAELERRLAELEGSIAGWHGTAQFQDARLRALEAQSRSTNALALDSAAVARRLSAIEDTLAREHSAG